MFLYQLVTAEGAHSMDWPTGWDMRPWSSEVALQFLRMAGAQSAALAGASPNFSLLTGQCWSVAQLIRKLSIHISL